ncbi:MFS transporter [Peribacillus glennii]|uniref:MFS transporter n=1 Tax=Peribacillus glennii TaxID=2303991 RepID=A0A372LBE5_9BACI|nr:MFS transporter [Peribacillus glennii]RFU62173.1 MFS transporter [Peribacillus glennii]
MTIAAIGSIPLIMTLGNSMLIPILPSMQTQLKLSPLQVSLTITVFSFAAAILIPVLGYLSDRYSRKAVIIPSLILYAVGGVLAGFAASSLSSPYPWILTGRILQGIGAAGTAPIAMALAGDLFKGGEQSRVLGVVEASNGLGKVLSPIIGSLLAIIVWYAPFYAFPIFCIISILLTWFFVKEKSHKQAPPPFAKYVLGIKHTFKQDGRWLVATYLAGATCLFALFGILFYLSDVLEKQYKIDGVQKGLILAIPLLVMCTTSYITGAKIGKNLELMKKLIIIGFFSMTISYALLAFFEKLVPFLFILVISSFGTGLVLPCVNTLITGSVGKEIRGFITSLYSSVRFLGVAIGPPVFTRLIAWSRTGMFVSIAILTLVVGLLALAMIHVKGKDGEKKKNTPVRYRYI